MWFKKDNIKEKLSRLQNTITASFSALKAENQGVKQWISYLNSKILLHESKYIDQGTLNDQIKSILDSHYYFHDLYTQLGSLRQRLDSMPHSDQNTELRRRIGVLEQNKGEVKSSIREKLLKKITRNSKDYIKSMLFSLIRKYGEVSAFQLKEMVVDEQGLCSKSSFYRLLAEIEEDPEINVLKKGKEKTYFSAVSRRERHSK